MKPTAQLRSLYAQAGNVEKISIRSIIATLGDNSFALILIVLALLSIALTPVPGQAMLMALPMIVICLQWLRGRPAVSLPPRLAAQCIPAAPFRAGLLRMLPVMLWLEKYCRQRSPALLTPALRQLSRIVLLLLSIALLVPIPLSHILPDIAIIAIALGELEDDGAMLAIGVVIGGLCLCAFTVIFMLLAGGVMAV